MWLVRLRRLAFCMTVLVSATSLPLHAQDEASSKDAATDTTEEAVPAASTTRDALQRGPQTIALRDQAVLNLPQGYGYLPTREAAELMRASGNTVDEDFIGLIVSLDEDATWMVWVEYVAAGYIKDDDASHWKADELLDNLKRGTEAANAQREKLGIPGLEVMRWIEPPAYDSAKQRLVWSIEAREKGAAAGADNTVNYNTYVLGRDGYISLNLITSAAQVEAQKPAAKALLAAVAFNDGKRYADFDSSTDKVAAYGLAALVGGLAAKKLGLLALAGVFLAKFFKIALVAVVAGGATIKKFFFGRKA